MKKFYPKHSGSSKLEILELIKDLYTSINQTCPLKASNLSDRDCQKFVNDLYDARNMYADDEVFFNSQAMIASILVRKTVVRLKKGVRS